MGKALGTEFPPSGCRHGPWSPAHRQRIQLAPTTNLLGMNAEKKSRSESHTRPPTVTHKQLLQGGALPWGQGSPTSVQGTQSADV